MTSLVFIPLVHLKVQRPEIKIHTYILPEIQNICKRRSIWWMLLSQQVF